MDKKLILVSDVHGRTFWKDIKPFVENDKIHAVFLGDYHDPYGFEGISEEESLLNFIEIIEFAKANKENVTLLLGNHDLTYFMDGKWTVKADRIDYENYDKLCFLFNKNKDLFKLAYSYSCDDRNFLITHAGVHPLWASHSLSMDVNKMTAKEISDTINDMLVNEDKALKSGIANVGQSRGGFDEVGSMVWADCHDFENVETHFTQIFSHTQQLKFASSDNGLSWDYKYVPTVPYVTGTNVCIDCHDNFYIDADNDLRYLKNDDFVY